MSVELVEGASGSVLAVATSDSNGRVAFSSGIGTTDNSFAYGLNFKQGANYLLRTVPDTGAILGLEATQSIDTANPTFNSDGRSTDQFVEINFTLDFSTENLQHLDFGFKLKPQAEAEAVPTDQLEPPSNVVSNPPANVANTDFPAAEIGTIFGFPIDLQNKFFLAFSGLVATGLCSLVIGIAGLITTVMLYRRRGNDPTLAAESEGN